MNALAAVPGLPQPGRTVVIGVVNVTPDSFSDGGDWLDPEAAIAHGRDLIEQGADIVEVGGESTRPGAARASVAEELGPLVPALSTTCPAAGQTPRCCPWSPGPACLTSACTGGVTPQTCRAAPCTPT